jgi:hypothetical protein
VCLCVCVCVCACCVCVCVCVRARARARVTRVLSDGLLRRLPRGCRVTGYKFTERAAWHVCTSTVSVPEKMPRLPRLKMPPLLVHMHMSLTAVEHFTAVTDTLLHSSQHPGATATPLRSSPAGR